MSLIILQFIKVQGEDSAILQSLRLNVLSYRATGKNKLFFRLLNKTMVLIGSVVKTLVHDGDKVHYRWEVLRSEP